MWLIWIFYKSLIKMVTAVIQIKKSTFVYYVNIVVAKKRDFLNDYNKFQEKFVRNEISASAH